MCFLAPYVTYLILFNPSFAYGALIYTPLYIVTSTINDKIAFDMM